MSADGSQHTGLDGTLSGIIIWPRRPYEICTLAIRWFMTKTTRLTCTDLVDISELIPHTAVRCLKSQSYKMSCS